MLLWYKSPVVFISIIASTFILTTLEEVSGDSATTRMHIQTSTAAWLEYRMLKENITIRLTKGNIKQGFKDAGSNTIIQVTTNNSNGYVISLHCETVDFISSVTVTTDTGTSYVLTPGSGVDIYKPYKGLDPSIENIDFRFNLSPNALVKEYPWPILITIFPL